MQHAQGTYKAHTTRAMFSCTLERTVRGFSSQSNVVLVSYEDMVAQSVAPGVFVMCTVRTANVSEEQPGLRFVMQLWPLKSLVAGKCRMEILDGFSFPSSSSSSSTEHSSTPLLPSQLLPQGCTVHIDPCFRQGPLSATRIQLRASAEVSIERQLRSAGFMDVVRDAVDGGVLMPGMHKPVPVVSHGEEITLQLTVMACEPALEDAKSSSKACCYRIDASTELSVTTSSSSSSSLSPSSSSDAAFSGIGGLDAQISQVCDLLDQALHSNQTFAEYGIKPPCGVLLHGPPGTGKSMLARALKGYCGTEVAFYSISGPEVVSRFSGDSEKKLRELWKEARAHEPSVIFIDEVDAICVSRDADTGDLQKRITATVMTLMDGLSGTTSSSSSSSSPSLGRVCVVGATNSPNTLDSALRRPGRFDREIEVGIPTAKQRRAILDCMLRGVTHGLSEGEVGQVTAQAHGFVGADLESLLSEAGIECFRRLEAQAHLDPLGGDAKDWECVLAYNDVQRALKRVKPSTLREFLIDVPSVKWTDIGGMHAVKRKLQESVEWPINHPEVFERLGIAPPQGVMLYGPPGCSKTLMAKALATESSRNFISIKGPELLSKWVGESEKAIARVFEKARQASPSIVFFDEIDSVALKRSSGSDASAVTDRVLSQLLVELDGVKALTDVVFVAATNRPDMLDPALLRPGRIDRILYVGLPDAETREAIIVLELKKLTCDESVDGKCVQYLVDNSEGFSGAEMTMICREAVMVAVEDDPNAKALSSKHLVRACNAATARTSPEMIAYYDAYRAQHSNLAC